MHGDNPETFREGDRIQVNGRVEELVVTEVNARKRSRVDEVKARVQSANGNERRFAKTNEDEWVDTHDFRQVKFNKVD